MPATWAYFDTSVLVKRYIREPGSIRARDLLRRYRFLSSAITPVETTSALRRRRIAGDLSERDLLAILSRIKRDRAYWELVEVSPQVLAQAEELIRKTDLRTLDALHVASVQVFQTASGLRIPFITGDQRQRDAGDQLGLDVVWVGPKS
jgi:predicted nucleic acid-binding protein